MKERTVKKLVQGQRAVDGAGVQLVRVLGHGDVYDFDPFLMLDAFDSTNPIDYTKGFPFHPHRGIETFTYLIKGNIEHKDSLGNHGSILDGEAQWMSAASGIMHEEMPKASDQMLGLQLWINMDQKDKMKEPAYHDLGKDNIVEVEEEHAHIRLLSGNYKGYQSFDPRFVKASILDVVLKANKEISIDTKAEDNVFIFTIDGAVLIDGKEIKNKTAVLFFDGDFIKLKAPQADTRFIVFMGKPLHQPIAWAGPVVMNTHEELNQAFQELNQGSFIKHQISK